MNHPLKQSNMSHSDDLGLTGGLEQNNPVDRIRGVNQEAFEDDSGIGAVLGSSTGESDRDVTPGGWAGTDDATSTAASDLADLALEPKVDDPEANLGRGYAGGLAQEDGGVVDLTGSPVEESRNWSVDSLLPHS